MYWTAKFDSKKLGGHFEDLLATLLDNKESFLTDFWSVQTPVMWLYEK